MDSTTTEPKETPQEKTVEYVEKKGKLSQLASLKAAKLLGWHADRQRRMMDAEDRKVASVLGWELSGREGGEDVEQNVLGDQTINNTTNQIAKGMGTAAAVALGAAFPTAVGAGALLWHFLGPQEKPADKPYIDETVEIGLGKIEDYFPKGDGDE